MKALCPTITRQRQATLCSLLSTERWLREMAAGSHGAWRIPQDSPSVWWRVTAAGQLLSHVGLTCNGVCLCEVSLEGTANPSLILQEDVAGKNWHIMLSESNTLLNWNPLIARPKYRMNRVDRASMKCHKGVWSLHGVRPIGTCSLWTFPEGCNLWWRLFYDGRVLSANNLLAVYSNQHLNVNSCRVQPQLTRSSSSLMLLHFHFSQAFKWWCYLVCCLYGRHVLYTEDFRQWIKTVLSSVAMFV